MHFLKRWRMGMRLKNLAVVNWCNKSQMLPVFQVEVFATHLKQGGIPLGILLRRPLFTAPHFVFLLFLYPIREKPWIIKLLYCELYRRLTMQPLLLRNILTRA